MRDEKGADNKVLCVASTDPRKAHLRTSPTCRNSTCWRSQHFFEVYKALEPGKEVVAATWSGRAEADAEIAACRERLAASGGH